MGWLSDIVDDVGDFFKSDVGQVAFGLATGGISALALGLGKPSGPPGVPVIDPVADPALAAERKAQKKDEERRRTLASNPLTMLTGAGGLLDEPSLSSRTLLGL